MLSKRILSALAIGILGAATLASPVSGQKVRIAVLGFENQSSWQYWRGDLGPAASTELVTQLVRSGEFSVIERERIDAVLEEQNLGQSGRVNPATAADIGRILGVQVVLLGSVTQFSIDTRRAGIGGIGASFTEAEAKLDIRAVNTATAEIMAVAEGSGKKRLVGLRASSLNFNERFDEGIALEALRPAVEDAAKEIVDHVDDFASITPVATSANIVGANAGTFYPDRGSNFGIEVGQRFEVLRVVDEIRDGAGNLLDRITDRVGVIEVTRVLSQSAICEVVEGDAAEGDQARAIDN